MWEVKGNAEGGKVVLEDIGSTPREAAVQSNANNGKAHDPAANTFVPRSSGHVPLAADPFTPLVS